MTVSDLDPELNESIKTLEHRFIALLNEKAMDEDYHTEITYLGGLVRLIKATVADLEKIISSFNSVQDIESYKNQTSRKLPSSQTVERLKVKKLNNNRLIPFLDFKF